MPITTFDLSPRRLGALLAVSASALAIGACGGGEETTASTSSSSSGAAAGESSPADDQDAAQVRLQRCLRENGVDIPDDVGQGAPPADIDQEALQEALEGPCEEYQEGAFGDVTEEDQQEFSDQFAKFAACMREEGIDVPEFTPGEGPPAGGGQIDTDDPDVQAAQEKCQDELPQGGPGGGGAQ